MKLVAITGSIGCGKTTICEMIRQQGYAVFDVDGWVRRMYYKKDIIAKIAKIFPGVAEEGAVDKRKLRNMVFNEPYQLRKLEALMHPYLKKRLKQTIHKYSRTDDMFFLDIALLFEMGWDKYCDRVVVADADYDTQKKRVMERDKIEAEDFDKINNLQINNRHKKGLADRVIDTNKPLNLLRREVIDMLERMEEC